MFEDYQICPYTGLRSFSEEESLYFKGREEHIDQATEQLQRNKFLMLTGASGDGKSSLVYAGIVPNARAGFLKSRYTQWRVADFRPERSPFKNFCKSLAKQLDIENADTVESELNHGFSALVDLYKNSKSFIDIESLSWQKADDAERNALKRSASNLIIIVDQFEEFFTNPENYQHGAPSRDSNLVLNVLLETARIALEENLPIYIVFTMRSDYIGQCAAFRSLPEYIGFSQFFVPRLNRAQLQQVIEEPASLSGNQISRRLTERLIHDVAEGVDQLPILQHALNQIWHAADQGKAEMDLIHYAMVGGMAVNELPENQKEKFTTWFAGLPNNIKPFYQNPSLQNVLDTHANKLYESAGELYRKNTNNELPDEDAKAIVKTAFVCLTKIDQSRAVRNRMTLKEITDIFGRKGIDEKIVAGVLNVFRESGNTFIRPFITDDAETIPLKADQVLDITHESLIRNWNHLEEWANEEFESYSVSLDFGQQLSRWVKSNKSNAHLFSIGPLTYFENWYNSVKPNAAWIARYLPDDIDAANKLQRAKRILNNSQEFLQQSARKHAITRAVMRYGPKRIAAVIGLIAIITLSSFGVKKYLDRQNSAVLQSVHEQTIQLIKSPKAALSKRVSLLVESVKSGQTTITDAIHTIVDPVQKVNVTVGVATLLVLQGNTEPRREIIESFTLADSLLDSYSIPEDPQLLASLLKEMNDLRVTLEFAYYHSPDDQINELRKKNAKRSAAWVNHIATKQSEGYTNIQEFSLALENAINHQAFSNEELKNLIAILSPFEGSTSEWVQNNFDKDKLLIRGHANYGYKFNGRYQLLSYLYAAQGNSGRVLQCMDTLLRYSENSYLNDYGAQVDNATNIAAVYFVSGQVQSLDDFVKGYVKRKGITEEYFYEQFLGRTLHSNNIVTNMDLYPWMGIKSNLNVQFSSRDQLSFFHSKYRNVVLLNNKNEDERNFKLAVSYKNEGIAKTLNKEKSATTELTSTQFFDKAFEYYLKVSQAYLKQNIKAIGSAGADQILVPAKYFFIYPDVRTTFHPLEPRSFFFFYSTDVFVEYILDNGLFNSLYPSDIELQFFSQWLLSYNSKVWVPQGFVTDFARTSIFKKLESAFAERKSESTDINWLYLYLGLDEQKSGNQDSALYYYRKLNHENVFNMLRIKEYGNNINNQSFRLICYAIEAFAKTGHFDEAYDLLNVFKKPINRSTLYGFAASELLLTKFEGAVVQQLLDSAKTELKRVEEIGGGRPHRTILSYALMLQDPSRNSVEASQLIKNNQFKFFAIGLNCRAYAINDQLYGAIQNIPVNISDTDRANFLYEILYGVNLQSQHDKSWNHFNEYYNSGVTHWIYYIDEGV